MPIAAPMDAHHTHTDSPHSTSHHSHTDCHCLCCPGHMVATTTIDLNGTAALFLPFNIAPAFLDAMALPSGVREELFRPPQSAVSFS
ncbi:MAG: hypothetical protein JXR76_16615 [Deltaproteobacteria bacterium]|nr:hypothetical protein [Deltaproteobacteria bacterium]